MIFQKRAGRICFALGYKNRTQLRSAS